MTTKTAGMAFEATLGEYDFDLYNRTNGWVLNGFYTQEGGKWSKNWLTTARSGKIFPDDLVVGQRQRRVCSAV
jgi:hypothetical protein